MRKPAASMLGIGVVAVAAVLVARSVLRPARDEIDRRAQVLSGAYAPRVLECRVLEDHELPHGVPAPAVGADEFYFLVTVLYPDHARIPEGAHALVAVNDVRDLRLEPVHVEGNLDADGATVYLTFRSSGDFQAAALARGETRVADRVTLP